MPGIRNVFIGLGLVALGVLITGATYAAAPGGHYVVAYGAVLAGALQACVGAVQWLGYQMKSPDKKAEHHLRVDMRVVVRSMLAVAAADGELHEGETVVIGLVSRSLFGEPLDSDTIQDVFGQMKKGGGSSYLEELETIASQVTPAAADIAVKAATMVALSDGELDAKEEQLLLSIANTLNVRDQRLSDCVHDARAMIENLLAAQHEERSTSTNAA